MKKSLKIKIFLSFLLLILMLVVAGVMSILELRKMGDSVETVMKDNYQSIEASKTMLDAVEREDSGVLIWMLGDSTKGSQIIEQANSVMQKSMQDARLNLSETNEDEYVNKVETRYMAFHATVQKIITSRDNLDEKKKTYSEELEALFIDTKSAINNLMILNQDQMYAQAAIMKENSRRSMMPGIISVVAAVLFAVLLNFFISIYFIHPIHKLIGEIKSFYPERRIIDAKITSHDEIKTLENEINNLITRLTATNKHL
jgi:CHASE3 domain sensor protein